MTVSVVVPLYQKAPFVRRALRSLTHQTFSALEVIVVDDGSTDGGDAIAKAWPDPRVRLVRQPNGGPGAARNRGAAEAKGSLLAFLDADDEWHPEFLARGVKSLEEAGPEVAATVCGHRVMPADTTRERLWRRRGVREGIFRATPQERALRFIHQLAFMSPCATLIRREAFERCGGFYARDRCLYGEDAYLFMRVLLQHPVSFRFDPLVTFHTDASALSNNLPGPRPLEPFLRFSEEFELECPRALRPLLREILSIRASKTACMLAWWGRQKEAEALLARFAAVRRLWHPWALAATVAVSGLGIRVGALARAARGQRPASAQLAGSLRSLPGPQLPASRPSTIMPPGSEAARPSPRRAPRAPER